MSAIVIIDDSDDEENTSVLKKADHNCTRIVPDDDPPNRDKDLTVELSRMLTVGVISAKGPWWSQLSGQNDLGLKYPRIHWIIPVLIAEIALTRTSQVCDQNNKGTKTTMNFPGNHLRKSLCHKLK